MNKKIAIIVIISLLLTIISIQATWCDTDFSKRINVSVNNTAGSALTDYQVYVNLSTNPINETSLRVYNSTSCTLRPHWCENITNSNCYGVWINYSAIAASAWTNNTAIYYDNAAASSTTNGTNTFEFFDDFEGVYQTSGSDYIATVTDITRDEDAYVYKDFTADHFDALDIDFEGKMTAGSSGICGIMALANSVDDLANLPSPAVNVIFHETTGTYKIWLNRGKQTASDSYVSVVLDTIYYMTLERAVGNDTIELKIYSDSARTNLLDTLSVSGFGTAKYRYLYAVASWDTNQADRTLSCEAGNISIDGGSNENLTGYTETDPNSRISVGQTTSYILDTAKWNTEYVSTTINHAATTVKLIGTTASKHGAIYAVPLFSSGVCSWKVTAYQQTGTNSGNTGVIYPYVETTNRDIFYWRTNGAGSWSEAALRINNAYIYQSSQESVNCVGITDVYFKEGYGKVVHDGVIKLDKTDVALTIPDGLRPWISTYNNNDGYITTDWVFVRKYASPEPSSALGSEEQQGANSTLHIGNAINIKEDWGRDFNSNLSANVTTANASGVWMNFTNTEFTNTSLGNLNLTLNEWVNESHNVNAPVANVSVNVYLNSITAGATNDTDSFWYEVTKRTNTATMDSAGTQNVDTSESFYVNATCNEEYSDTFLGAANLLEDGVIIDTDNSVTDYVNFSHSEGSAGVYNYTIRFYNLTHYDNATTPTYSNVTVFDIEYIPPDATTLCNITGNFWVNHTWSMGTPGNVTNSYNVSIGGVWWYNTTTVTYYNDSALSAHAWNNATVWAYNTSGNGSLSSGSISDSVQIPNNIPVLSGLPDNTTDEDVNQTDIFDLDDYFSDVDGDTPTYLVESNNQSAYISVTINASNNVSYTLASGWNGTASIIINATDGWGGEDSDTFLIVVNAAPLPGDYIPGDPTTLQNTTGNYWVNFTWSSGGGANATDSYNVSWNLTWYNITTDTFMKKEVGASNWGNITVYAYNSSGNGSLSTGHLSDNVQAPAYIPGDYPPATPTTLANTTGNGWVHYTWSSGGGANVTNSYNVSWNSTWYNTTLIAYMNDTVGEFGWANITVFAFNSSGNGSLSAESISDETQADGGTFTTSMGTTAYNLITYYGSATSTAELFGLDIGSVDYIAMYNGSFYTHTMGFGANNFTTYHGIGYYVYLNATGSSTYQRSNILDVPYNTQLFNRWNTIGWTNATNTNAEGVATSIGSACKYTSTLNADGVTYTTHTVGFTSNNHAVIKGEGYWVWTNAGVNWGRNS